MRDYWRAIRMALKYRWTVMAAIACSLLVAIAWGGNIGALYPVIQVAFKGQSLQTWIDQEVLQAQDAIQEKTNQLANLSATSPDAFNQKQANLLRYEIGVEQSALALRQKVQPIIHRYLPDDPFQTVVLIVGLVIAGTLFKCFFVFVNAILIARLEQRTTLDLRKKFYHQALRMDLRSFGQEKTSGLLSQFNTDINCLTTGIRNLFGSAVREPLKMIACLIGASIISWRLLLFSLILSPVIGYAIRKLAGSIKRANRRILEEISQLYGVLSETFNGIQTVQAYTLESHERKRFHEVSKECFHKAMRISFYSALTKPITEVMGISMISLALLAGAYLTLNQETHLFGIRMSERPIDLPSLLVFYGLLIGTTEPARKLSEIFNSIQAGLAAAGRLFPLLDQTPAIRNPTEPVAFPVRHASIAFENVSFEYEPETRVLENVSFDVKFGETLAIVGPNGCGKSTLLQLIPRFFDPTTGTVRMDNIDLRSFRLKELRRRIGVVSQQADLFDDTVMENIRRGHAGASQLDVVRAAKKARAHDFIMDRLSDGYDTIVGPTGSRLSGGQRQRVALARAIIRDPEILILDEATSQIDLESERLIHQALDEFTQDRTTFIITHRLSTISLADRILVLNQGRVEDIGTHEELLKRCSTYVRLNRLHRDQTA